MPVPWTCASPTRHTHTPPLHTAPHTEPYPAAIHLWHIPEALTRTNSLLQLPSVCLSLSLAALDSLNAAQSTLCYCNTWPGHYASCSFPPTSSPLRDQTQRKPLENSVWMLLLKANRKQVFVWHSTAHRHELRLSPSMPREPGGANKETATPGKLNSSSTFQPAASNFAPVCKVLLNPADGTQSFQKWKKKTNKTTSLLFHNN